KSFFAPAYITLWRTLKKRPVRRFQTLRLIRQVTRTGKRGLSTGRGRWGTPLPCVPSFLGLPAPARRPPQVFTLGSLRLSCARLTVAILKSKHSTPTGNVKCQSDVPTRHHPLHDPRTARNVHHLPRVASSPRSAPPVRSLPRKARAARPSTARS